MTDFEALIRLLAQNGVEYILVGGAAATAHGAARLTLDLDIVYRRTPDNLERLASSLAPYHPYLRGAPPGLPFRLNAATIRRGCNITLVTDLGDIDLLGEITGGGRYEDLLPDSLSLTLFGNEVRCLGLRRLIEVKRAAGRPKDFDALAELEALLEERGDAVPNSEAHEQA
jgi:hypothetical protein